MGPTWVWTHTNACIWKFKMKFYEMTGSFEYFFKKLDFFGTDLEDERHETIRQATIIQT